jgi:hypothetical protein
MQAVLQHVLQATVLLYTSLTCVLPAVLHLRSLLAARAPWAVPEHLLHAQQRDEVPAQLLQKGAAGEAILPVPRELLLVLLRHAKTFRPCQSVELQIQICA